MDESDPYVVNNTYQCPRCWTRLWKWNAKTGMYCHSCGTRVREKIHNVKYIEYSQKTLDAFTTGFFKGFILAGFIGFWFDHGILTGLVWGAIWGTYRYFTGTPYSSYGETYLTFY